MSTNAFDVSLIDATAAKRRQNREITEQQRVQSQNTVGTRLLDAINNAGNIKPDRKNPDTGAVEHNPEYDNAQTAKQQLMDQYNALMSPEQHANFGDRLHGLIFGQPTPHAQQPALSPNSSPVTPPPDQNAPPAAAAPAAPAPPPHPMAPLPADHPMHAITNGIQALGNHLKAFAQPLPPPVKPDTALMAKYYRDPAEVAHERTMDMWNQRGANALEIAKMRLDAMLAGKPPRPVGDFITIPHLVEQMKEDPDMAVVGPDKHMYTPAELMELPEGMLAHAYMKGNDVVFGFGDPKTKMWNMGGQAIQVPTYGPVTTANSTPLAVSNSALERVHEVPGMNPGEKLPLHSGVVATPGMIQPPAPQAVPVAAPPAPAGEPPNPTLKTRPAATPAPSASMTAINNRLNQKKSQSRQVPAPDSPVGVMPAQPQPFAPGTFQSQGKTTKPILGSMSVVAANVFGGNGNQPIWSNADMYDNPELASALNKALTLNQLTIPGTEDDPSFMQTIATAVGATGWSQEQIRNANDQARADVERLGGQRALDMFARLSGFQEDLTALRKATSGSAAASTVRTMVRAAPIYNVHSSQDFRNQLSATLNTAAAALKGYPEINPSYIKWWEQGARMAKGGPTSSNAPRVPAAGTQPIRTQHSASTGQDRYSTDGGKTWQMGKPPQQ